MPRRKQEDQDTLVAAGGVALVGSILANLKQYGENEALARSVEALQRLVQDWQTAHHNLETQLTLALRSNAEQAQLIAAQRDELERIKSRAYAAEQRALEAEAELERVRRSAKSAKDAS